MSLVKIVRSFFPYVITAVLAIAFGAYITKISTLDQVRKERAQAQRMIELLREMEQRETDLTLLPEVAAELRIEVDKKPSELEQQLSELREALERGVMDGSEQSVVSSENADLAKKFNDDLQAFSIIKLLSTAPVAYNRLTELWYRKPETVVYRVDLSSPNGPTLPVALKGERVHVELPVTPNMSVELTGSAGLDIEPKGKIKKRVSDIAATSWEWQVTPIDSGEQFLILKTYVHFSEDKDSEPYTVKSYEDVIRVNVKFWDRLALVASTVQPVWAFAAIVVTGLLGAFGWYRRRGWRASKEPVSDNPGSSQQR